MYETLLLNQENNAWHVTLNRVEKRNSLNATVIHELLTVLQQAQQDSNNRFIILQGQGGFFCTGMDLELATQPQEKPQFADNYIQLLHTLAAIPRVVICCVDGIAMAGGIGLLAASDLVIATPKSKFSLTEVLWGLLPCCVAPYLIRRLGFQAAYRLTLTTQQMNAEEAQKVQLIDYIMQELSKELPPLLKRLSRTSNLTIANLKNYFSKLWIINENMESFAVSELNKLIQSPEVQNNLQNYINHGKFPWEV